MASLSNSAKLDLAGIAGRSGLAFHWCTSLPANRAAALTASAANKSAPGVTVGADKVTIDAISDGTITGNDTAVSHWALIDGTELIAAGSLSSSQTVYTGNTISVTAIDITPGSVTES